MEVKPGFKQTEVGVIPEDWEVKSLDSFCEISAGRDLVKEDYSPASDHRHEYPIYSNALANGGLYGYSKSYQYGADKITVTARGDIGHALYRSTHFCAIGRLLVLSSTRSCDLRFVTEFINNYVDFALESTGVPQLTAPQISKYAVALPPTKAEQEAIAEALSDADALIESLEQLFAKKRQFKQGAMQELLTGKKRLPGFRGEWEVRPIGSFSAFITKGATPTTYGFNWEGDGVLFLRSECVSDDGLDLAQSMFVSEAAHAALIRGEVRSGDILMTITGNVGRVVHLKPEFGCANINQHIARIRVKDPDVLSDYVHHWLSQPSVRAYYTSITTGQAYPQISLKQVRETQIPLPPISEQTAIAAILSDMDAEIAGLEAKLAKARQVKQGMTQELLTGRIRLV